MEPENNYEDSDDDDDIPFSVIRKRKALALSRSQSPESSTYEDSDDDSMGIHACTHPPRHRLLLQPADQPTAKSPRVRVKRLSYRRVSVEQLGLDGRVIMIFPSINAAATAVNATNISQVLNGTRAAAGGYKWRRNRSHHPCSMLDEGGYKRRKRITQQPCSISVEQLDDNGCVIGTFPSCSAASVAVGIPGSSYIGKVLKGKAFRAAGYMWRRTATPRPEVSLSREGTSQINDTRSLQNVS